MVVTVGLTLVEPLADVDVKVPGAMAILVAPVTIQLNVLLVPEAMLVGFAVKEAMVGAEALIVDGVIEPQLGSPTPINRIMRTSAPCAGPEAVRRKSSVRALPLAPVGVPPLAGSKELPPGVEARFLDPLWL